MLEPIRLGQGRTNCPGLAADERGVAMGRFLAIFFADISRTVGFFRSYSREVSLDDIISTLEIREAVGDRGGREIMVRFTVDGSYNADRAAQSARLHKGRVFTGTERHFVPYRDRRAPLGYDLATPNDTRDESHDAMLYTDAGTDARSLERSIQLPDLILGLSPRLLTSEERETEQHSALVLRCESGLLKTVCRYLWSRQVRARISTTTLKKRSLFGDKNKDIHLIRCENMPKHIASFLHTTPGCRAFVPVADHLLVEWGFRHPIALESVAGAFNAEETLLFFGNSLGNGMGVEKLASTEGATDIRDLVDVKLRGDTDFIYIPKQATGKPIDALQVPLRLSRVPDASASTTALLIDINRLPWFMQLVYMLPAAILRSYEAAIADPYIVVINRRGIHGIPFGIPMFEAYPQVFVPVGMQILPRVDYDLLREHLQIRPEQNLYFLLDNGPTIAIAQDILKPLARAAVAPDQARQTLLQLKARSIVDDLPASTLRHTDPSTFSLWQRGNDAEREVKRQEVASKNAAKQLPAPASASTAPTTPNSNTPSSES